MGIPVVSDWARNIKHSSAGWWKMKVRSARTLHPLSLVTMILFRGSVALGHACRSKMARMPCCFALFNSRVASSCPSAAPRPAGSNVGQCWFSIAVVDEKCNSISLKYSGSRLKLSIETRAAGCL